MTLIFYIRLKDGECKVWRKVAVPANYTFYQLHLVIQAAFGWQDDHLFQFSQTGIKDEVCYKIPSPEYDDAFVFENCDARIVKITDVIKEKQKYSYA